MQARPHHVREGLKLALDTLRTHKFRSFLTVLGVLIGTSTVIVVTSIFAGLDRQLVDVAEQFGTRTLWVYKLQLGAPHQLSREERLRKPLSYEDAMAMRGLPHIKAVTAGMRYFQPQTGRGTFTLSYQGKKISNVILEGDTAAVKDVFDMQLSQGRWFSDIDDEHHSRRAHG